MDVQQFFLRYLLLPLIAVAAATVMAVANKKNKFINNKKLIISVLLLSIALAIPGPLGFLGLSYMPWGYIISQIYHITLGSVFVYLMTKYYPDELLSRKLFIIIALLIACLLGFYLYQTIFNALSDIKTGIWAATSTFNFVIPLLFWWSYVALLSIPAEIYKIWKYPAAPINLDMEHLDFNRMLVLELEVYKHTNDPEPIKVKV
ncbi:MAG TPA: TssN family type VI secretion system protein, partial [Mucilaginibacter sp.]|nr:TssN family type VI secretion system protein [Mucilaginibacter sp.]